MPGQLQEGFGCVVTNRFDQLLDDESDPFEILKAAETKKKEGAAAGSTKTAAQAAKQPKKESQKDRKNPLLDKKEESQAPVPLKKEGKILPPASSSARCGCLFCRFPLSCAAFGANVSCRLSARMSMWSDAPRLARQQKVVGTGSGQGCSVQQHPTGRCLEPPVGCLSAAGGCFVQPLRSSAQGMRKAEQQRGPADAISFLTFVAVLTSDGSADGLQPKCSSCWFQLDVLSCVSLPNTHK